VKISSDDIAPLLTALGGFLTVVGGLVTNIVMMVRQNRKLEGHTNAIRKDIEEVRSGQTGTQKALGP